MDSKGLHELKGRTFCCWGSEGYICLLTILQIHLFVAMSYQTPVVLHHCFTWSFLLLTQVFIIAS